MMNKWIDRCIDRKIILDYAQSFLSTNLPANLKSSYLPAKAYYCQISYKYFVERKRCLILDCLLNNSNLEVKQNNKNKIQTL